MAFACSLVTGDNICCRLRVVTLSYRHINVPLDLYRNVDQYVIATILAQQTIATALHSGQLEAKDQLLDRYAAIVSCAHKWFASTAPPNGTDPSLPRLIALQFLPKILFGLFRSVLFDSDANSDVWATKILQWRSSSPTELCHLLYPDLSAFKDVNSEPPARHLPLSNYAINSSGYGIFVLDTVDAIIVFYKADQMDAPFPPPKTSPVRSLIQQMKEDRSRATVTIFTRSGFPDENIFLCHLIDDPMQPASTLSSYGQFLEIVQAKSTKMYMQRMN